MRDGVTRRNFVRGAGVAAGAALAGCTGSSGSDSSGTGSSGNDSSGNESSGQRPVKYLGILPYAFEEEVNKFEDYAGWDLSVKTTSLSSVTTEILGGGAQTYDMAGGDATVIKALQEGNALHEVPVNRLDRWEEDKIADVLTKPQERLDYLGDQAKQLSELLWADASKKEKLALAPVVFGHDSVASNPKKVDPSTEKEWSILFDDRFNGRSMVTTNAIIGASEVLMHLLDNDMIEGEQSTINQPTEEQIDAVVDFLIKQKDAGQFRKLWTSSGTSTNLLANEEVYVGDPWQVGVMQCRRKGTPCQYNTLVGGVQGYRFWVSSTHPTKPGATQRNNLDEVYKWLNELKYGAWYPGFVHSQVGYGTPNYANEELVRSGSDQIGEGMGPEFYDWAFRGKKTYKTIEEPFLFDPAEYEWSMEEGSPASDGKPRDEGSISLRNDRIGYFQLYPENGDYLLEQWKQFTSA